ncbi:MAG: cell wall hydrolase [Erythrobacter sp.]|nr:cell wall hydrolase [Erythrobacter sp.]
MNRFAPMTSQQQLALRRRARADRRGRIVRRLGVVAAALAVPALAAETGFAPHIEQAPAAHPQLQGFETPGESFPGSAFYYLDDTSTPLGAASMTSHADRLGELAEAQLLDPLRPQVGPAAAAMVAMGSGNDIARSQQCLTQAVYYEAASESDAGQRAVAQVVLNRVAHSAWPNTVCGVVYQGSARSTGCQFTFTCDGSLRRQPSQAGWDRAARVARAALAGYVYAPVGLSTHYHTLAVNPYWAPTLTRTTVIGAHVFYRLPGVAGERDAFAFAYRGGEPDAAHSRSQSAGPDPVAVAQVQTLDALPQAAAVAPPAPVSVAEAAPATDDHLPTSGGVRPEYARSGQWITRP